MTEGLKNLRHTILKQEQDPLEWFMCVCPFPSRIGIPCQPCDLPNTFNLFQCDSTYKQLGMKVWELTEQSSCFQRTLCFPSMRPFKITSKDFYSEIPVEAEKPLRFKCFAKQIPELTVNFQGEYIGKIIEPLEQSHCKGIFHRLLILNEKNELQYELKAKITKGVCLWLPEKCVEPINYQIMDKEQNLDGEIKHLFNGFQNELCSKADMYGITYPEAATEQQKVLITMAALFIDYQWFENN